MAIPTLNAVGFCAHYSDAGRLGVRLCPAPLAPAPDPAQRVSFPHRPVRPERPLRWSCFRRRSGPNSRSNEKKNCDSTTIIGRAITSTSVSACVSGPSGWNCTAVWWCANSRCWSSVIFAAAQPLAAARSRNSRNPSSARWCWWDPERPDQFQLNSPARLIVNKLGLESEAWTALDRLPA